MCEVHLVLLGEPELWAGGRRLELGSPQQQTVLAALAVEANRPASVATLVDRVWGDAPPAGALNVLYSRMSRIRQLLSELGPDVRVRRRPAGYVLDLPPDAVDVHRFRSLTAQAQCPGWTDVDRATALRAALDLWRGSPLAGLPGAWAARTRDSWRRQRFAAVLAWADASLRLGHTTDVVLALADLADDHPLDEPVHSRLITALHAAGRTAEALARYTAVRRRLVEELGVDPGPALQAAHAAALRSHS